VIALFFFSALLTALDEKYRFASSEVKEWTSNLSSETLIHFIGYENPYFTQVLPKNSHVPSLSALGLELITSIEPGDIRSLLGSELPGFNIYDSDIIVAGEGTNYTNLPHESAPPVETMMKEREVATDKLKQLDKQDKQDHDKVTPPVKTTGDKKVVYLYNSHNTESYLPVLKGATNADSAYSSKVNVTDVSERLARDLQKRGIGTIVNQKSIQAILKKKGLQYGQSYDVSRNVVAAALKNHPDIQLILDIHRDSAATGTTATINGEKYSRISFILGEANPHYDENKQMAIALNNMLEDQYPGLSKGVFGKSNRGGNNGLYNQDLSNHAVLIEVGGVSNTMEENYHTADALADIISQYYWDLQQAKKVNGE
jgi:stage II sporulation protein P